MNIKNTIFFLVTGLAFIASHTHCMEEGSGYNSDYAQEWARQVVKTLENLKPEDFDQKNIKPQKGCLLTGPTLTGKLYDFDERIDYKYITRKRCLESLQKKIATCPDIQDLIKEYQERGVEDGSVGSLLDILCSYDHGGDFKDVLKYVLQKSSLAQINPNKRLLNVIKNSYIYNPSDDSAKHYKDTVLLLINYGANPYITVKDNKNVCDMALEKRYGSDFVKQMKIEHLVAMISTYAQRDDQSKPYWIFPIDIARLIARFKYNA